MVYFKKFCALQITPEQTRFFQKTWFVKICRELQIMPKADAQGALTNCQIQGVRKINYPSVLL
jgi:hypothetical protein